VIPPHHRRDQAAHQGGGPRARTSASARSAVRSVTSRACRSSRRSASSAGTLGRQNTLYVHLTLVPFIPTAGELQDQADAAQREGADRPRHPARRPPLPRDAPAREEGEGEDRALLQRRGGERHQRPGRGDHLRGAAPRSTARVSTSASSRSSTSSPARPNLSRWRRIVSAIKNPKETVEIAMVGKYGRPDRLLQEPERGAHARRHRERVPREPHLRRFGEDRAGRAPGQRQECRRDPRPDGFRPARDRGEDRGPSGTRARAGPLPSASASACRWR